ncbi:MAG: hypothetical protein AAGC81_19115, partial [Pseudomonadota bacterium]
MSNSAFEDFKNEAVGSLEQRPSKRPFKQLLACILHSLAKTKPAREYLVSNALIHFPENWKDKDKAGFLRNMKRTGEGDKLPAISMYCLLRHCGGINASTITLAVGFSKGKPAGCSIDELLALCCSTQERRIEARSNDRSAVVTLAEAFRGLDRAVFGTGKNQALSDLENAAKPFRFSEQLEKPREKGTPPSREAQPIARSIGSSKDSAGDKINRQARMANSNMQKIIYRLQASFPKISNP